MISLHDQFKGATSFPSVLANDYRLASFCVINLKNSTLWEDNLPVKWVSACCRLVFSAKSVTNCNSHLKMHNPLTSQAIASVSLDLQSYEVKPNIVEFYKGMKKAHARMREAQSPRSSWERVMVQRRFPLYFHEWYNLARGCPFVTSCSFACE